MNTDPDVVTAQAPSWPQLVSYLFGCVEKESSFAEPLSRSSTRSKYVATRSIATNVLADVTSDIAVDRTWRSLAEEAKQRDEALFVGWPVVVFHQPTSSGARRRKLAPLIVAEVQLPPKGMPIPDTLPLASDPTLHPYVLGEYGLKEENVAQLLADYPLEMGQGSTEALTAYASDIVAEVGIPVAEPLDASAPARTPEGEIDGPGASNSAIFFRAQAATYHAALLDELRTLRKLDPSGSAAAILTGEHLTTPPSDPPSILSPVALNESQEAALEASFTRSLTVVTGPPGTGKSQLVTAAMASYWAAGQSVLLASTNNQAVDVVVERAGSITEGLVVRTGNREHREQASQQLRNLTRSAGPTAALESLEKSVRESRDEQLRARQAIEERTELETKLSEQLLTFEHLAERHQWDLHPLKDSQDIRALRSRAQALKEGAEERARLEQRRLAIAETLTSLEEGLVDLEALRRIPHDNLVILHRRVNRLRAAWFLPRWRWGRLARNWELPTDFEKADEVSSVIELIREDHAADARLGELATWDQLRASCSELGIEPPPPSLPVPRALEHLLEVLSITEHLKAQLAEEAQLPPIGELWRALIRATEQHQEDAHAYLKALVQRASSAGSNDIYRYATARYDYRTQTGAERHFPDVLQHLKGWAVTSLSTARVMPLARNLFDLVIVDEASQCSLPSVLPLLYRAKRALIIGDPLQLAHISTLTATAEREQAKLTGTTQEALMEHRLSYRKHSAYAACESRVERPHLLDEHYRSHPHVIGLSNKLFYKGALTILTDPARLFDFGDPAVAWQDVTGRVVRPEGGSAFNATEASAAVEALADLMSRAPDGATFGVVTPFSAQAQRITREAEARLSASRRAAVQLEIGTAHRFQGDERDIIIFSPVLSEGIASSSERWLLGTPNLFNVAVTRARSFLLVVGDLQRALNSGGFLAELARYVRDLRVEDRVVEAASTGQLHSQAEERLYRALLEAGVDVRPKARVAGYECDFVVGQNNMAVNIECDGSQHYDAAGRLRRQDLARDRLLEMQGYAVLRYPAWRCLLAPREVAHEVIQVLER